MKHFRFFSRSVLFVMMLFAAVTASAQGGVPTIKPYNFGDASFLFKMSGNGEWAVAYNHKADAQSAEHLVNLTAGTQEEIRPDKSSDVCKISDVTNDGNIVCGQVNGKPAYWQRSTGKWTELPLPEECTGGMLNAISGDGKYVVGTGETGSEWTFRALVYNLTDNTLMTLPGFPVKDMSNKASDQVNVTDISDDGRYLLVSISTSYMDRLCSWVYDMTLQKAVPLGFTADGTSRWQPLVSGLRFTDADVMSADGKWYSGIAYINDNAYAFRYNIDANEFEAYNKSAEDVETAGFAIDNNGVVYGASPATGSPLREWSVRNGKYWYPLSQILKQKYGMDFYDYTKFDITGTVCSVSGDGRRFLSFVDPQAGESYFMETPEVLGQICADLNILGDYVTSPYDGASFSKARTFRITFMRDIEYIGDYKNIKLVGESGHTVMASSTGVAVSIVDPKTLSIGFFPTTLNPGEKYTLTLPKGSVCVKDDREKVNDDITVHYTGRANEAVKATEIYPADGAQLSKIDYNGSPVIITFNAPIIKSDNAKARLEMIDGDNVTLIANLNTAYEEGGKRLAVYPATAQNLYLGSSYRVTLDAGSVTDAMGDGGNEEIVVNYEGNFERETSYDDATLYANDFSNASESLNKTLLYEGDHNTPTSDMAALEFDADNTPWHLYMLEGNGERDAFAGSHSSYNPAGKSDDWMMTPQIFIPTDACKLTFDAQSYKKSANDRLKVVVWESNTNVQWLTDEVMARVKAEGKVVFDEQLETGPTEDGVIGEFKKYTVDLSAYAGKDIHIGFLNDNEGGSMVFVDNILVERDMKYLLTLNTEETVVNQQDITIGGKVKIDTELESYSSIKLTLKDAEGNVVDEVAETGLSLTNGTVYNFKFAKPLPLTVGKVNNYTIDIKLDDYTDVFKGKIKNLSFQPEKNVVLEEYTGTTCINCPQGIIAIEKLREVYGSRIIPVSLHCYTGDAWGSGLTDYSSALGLSAAPSGIVNRNGIISYPMWTNPGTGDAELSNGANLWMDYVNKEINIPAEASVSAKVTEGNTANTFNVPVTVRYAMTADNLNLNVFTVLMEDGLIGQQENAFSSSPDPLFGKWGQGGIYGQPTVYNVTHDDVVRYYYGNVFGTPGLFPSHMNAGEDYTINLDNLLIPATVENKNNTKVAVMLLDANTGKIINAVCASLNPNTGVGGITTENDTDISVNGESVSVTAAGDATVELYAVSGTLVGRASGRGVVTLHTAGYKGMAVVKVSCGGKSVVKKVML